MIVRELAPGPMIFKGVLMAMLLVHVTEPEPAVTLMVSPADAPEIQELTLDSSGVDVQVGLLPEHCAAADGARAAKIAISPVI